MEIFHVYICETFSILSIITVNLYKLYSKKGIIHKWINVESTDAILIYF